MKPDPPDVELIASRTLAHYEQNAESYRAGTADHDVSQNISALLDAIDAEPPFTLLDFGCGPGRDLKTFAALGHTVVGLDGSSRFVAMARDHSGCEVWRQNFLALDLPARHFHGVFANATLFHAPSQELPRVLGELYACLKPGGVLFSSIPHGQNQEGWVQDRYGVFHDLDGWRHYLSAAGFTELSHYYRPPNLPREQQPWLASLWRRPA